MEPKIVLMDINAAKITITPTRFEVKLPTTFDSTMTVRILAFAKDVAAKVGTPSQSLRGTISSGGTQLSVRLKRDNKEVISSFIESVPPSTAT